ncbi:hypothetical protein Peur_043502 [Populus x canadensis]
MDMMTSKDQANYTKMGIDICFELTLAWSFTSFSIHWLRCENDSAFSEKPEADILCSTLHCLLFHSSVV